MLCIYIYIYIYIFVCMYMHTLDERVWISWGIVPALKNLDASEGIPAGV